MVLHDFGDTIHLVLALMHSYYRICGAHSVYLAALLFFREYRPFPHAHGYLYVGCGHLRSDVTDLQPAFLDHYVEIGVDVPPGNLVGHLPLSFVDFLLLHLLASLCPLAFHVRDVVKEAILFLQTRLLRLRLARPHLWGRVVVIHPGLGLALGLLW